MCGIFGELTLNNKQTEKSLFLDILQFSKNRGPDKQGYYSNNSFLQFGFNRLKILDLSENGNQPLISSNKRYIMVFNGEIYNYYLLRRELKNNGVNFRGSGDSEVLINCFQYFGIKKTLDKIDGMFAIGLFDSFEKKLHLIRDFAGIKPLHYGYKNGEVVFASQYNQVCMHPLIQDESYNLDVLKLYLAHQFIPSHFGLLKNTHQILPGEMITFDLNGCFDKYRFWKLPVKIKPEIFDENIAIDKIQSSISNSVKMQMVSDVPLGVFLSSGIDSTLISLLAKENSKNILNAFTIGSDSIKHDESFDARIYADLIGLNQNLRQMNSSIVENLLDDFCKSITEPFADFSLIPTYYISSVAKEHVTVALSGDGADELFFGYERFFSIFKNYKVQSLPYILKYFIYGFDKLFWGNKHINSNSLFSSQGDAHLHLQQRFHFDLMHKIFPNLKETFIPENFDIYDYEKPKNKNELLQFMRRAEFYGMMQKTLRKVDMASMHHSLEVRVPFLNKDFIDTALTIDPFLNFKNDSTNKNILRKIIYKKNKKLNLKNKKKGFSVPLSRWLRQDLNKHFSDILMDHSLINHFGIDRKIIEKLIFDHLSGKKDNKWPMFTIYSLFNWKQNLSK